MHTIDRVPPVENAARNDRLLRAIRDLSGARTLDAITEITRDAARQLSRADGVTFVLREGDMCYYADESAISPLWKGRRFPMSACISGWVMEHDRPAVIADIYQDERIPHDAYRPTFVRSLAMVPVRAPRPIAAIGAYWASTYTAADEELGVMQSLADSTALALTAIELRAALDRAPARADAVAAVGHQDFIAFLSHELRQPLGAMTTAFELMQRQMSPESLRRVGKTVEVFRRQIDHLQRFTDDLLEGTSVVRGNVVLHATAIDLRIVLDDVAQLVRGRIEEKGQQFTVELPDDPVTIAGDPRRLQQVFMNLLNNATAYTPAGGSISLSLARNGMCATARVRDTGQGISAADLPRIFDLFTRGSEQQTEGFGIGLAVASRLVQLHGGTLDGRSDGPGRGSEFIVSLPVAPEPPR